MARSGEAQTLDKNMIIKKTYCGKRQSKNVSTCEEQFCFYKHVAVWLLFVAAARWRGGSRL